MKKGLLLVEGKDDQNVIWAICNKQQLLETFEVLYPKDKKDDSGGYEKLIKGLPIRLREEQHEVIGIVVDADLDLTNRWQSLKDILLNYGYKLPSSPQPLGTIVENIDKDSGFPVKIGIWIMPNNQSKKGVLEDFLESLIKSKDLLLPHAHKIIAEVETQVSENQRFKDVHKSKALIHTWLAFQDEPGKPLGQAVTKFNFDHDNTLMKSFVDWLNRLFNSQHT
jgi:hypothetical protein